MRAVRGAMVVEDVVILGMMASDNSATEAASADALVDDGDYLLSTRAAAAATTVAITAAMLEWAVSGDLTLGEALLVAFETLERRDG
jgi:hypothetical protein